MESVYNGCIAICGLFLNRLFFILVDNLSPNDALLPFGQWMKSTPALSILVMGYLLCFSHFLVAFKLHNHKRWAFNVSIILFAINLFSGPLFFLSIIGFYGLFNQDTSKRMASA